MIRVIKGDIMLDCDTEAELRIALAVLREPDPPPVWRVGGPTDGGLTSEQWEHGR